MPDGIQPVGAMVQPPNAQQTLGTLSGIYGIQQARQNLQTGAYQQQSAQANAQQDQQKNTELQKAQQVAIEGARSGAYDDGNGGIDRQKMANDILKVAPVYGQPQVTSLLSQANEVVKNQQAHQDLTVSQKKEMGQTFASLAADPNVDNSKVIDAIEGLRQAHPNDPAYSRLLTSQVMHLPNTASSDQLRSTLSRFSAAATGTPQATASSLDTGTQIQPGQTNNSTGEFTPAGKPISKSSVVEGPGGSMVRVDNFGRTATTLTSGAPQSQGNSPPSAASIGHDQGGRLITSESDPARPSTNAPAATWNSWNKSVDDARSHVEQTRQADSQYGNQMAIADQVRHLSSQTNTGPGTPEFTRLEGMVTSRFGGSEDVSNTQKLESFLDRQAASMRSAMDLPSTNAGAEQARVIGGNVGMQGGAIRAKNDYNEALAQGLHDYRTGLDHVEGFSGSPSPSAVNQYKSQWSQNFDPKAYEWKLAVQRGDKDAANAITSGMTPAQRAEMQRKGRALDALIQGRSAQ